MANCKCGKCLIVKTHEGHPYSGGSAGDGHGLRIYGPNDAGLFWLDCNNICPDCGDTVESISRRSNIARLRERIKEDQRELECLLAADEENGDDN